MKRIISVLIACCAAATLSAQPRTSTMLKLRLSDASRIAVELDGRYIDRETTSLTLDGLRPGSHRIVVYHTDDYRRRPFRLYSGTIRLKASTVYIGVVDVRARVLRMRSEWRDAQVEDRDIQRNDDSDDSYPPDEPAPPLSNRADPPQRSNETSSPQPGTLSRSDMDAIAVKVNDLKTDTDKERLMKTELAKYRISTAQVRVMLHWLAFESTRLQFAIWAYDRCADRNQYHTLEDEFELSPNKSEFRKSISK